MKRADISTENTTKLFFALAFPSVLMQIVNMLYSFVDRIFIGNMEGSGTDALAGLGVSLPVTTLLFAFAVLIGRGAGPVISLKLGKGDVEGAEKTAGCGIILMAFLSVVLSVCLLLFLKPVLFLFGCTETAFFYAEQYLKIYLIGNCVNFIGTGAGYYLLSQGKNFSSMLYTVLSSAVNVALDALFIFGFGMGIAGAALATVISQFAFTVAVILTLSLKSSSVRLKFSCLRFYPKEAAEIFRYGATPFVMQLAESATLLAVNYSLLKFGGEIFVSAMVILTSVKQLFALSLTGMTQGAQSIISYNVGRGRSDLVKKTFRLLLTVSMIYSVSVWALCAAFSNGIISLFTSDLLVSAIAEKYYSLYISVFMLFGLLYSCQTSLLAVGACKTALFLAFLRKVFLLVPLTLLLPYKTGVAGVFVSEPLADFITIVCTAALFYVKFKGLAVKKVE